MVKTATQICQMKSAYMRVIAPIGIFTMLAFQLPTMAAAQENSLPQQLLSRSSEEVRALDEGLQRFAFEQIALALGPDQQGGEMALSQLTTMIMALDSGSWRRGEEIGRLGEIHAVWGNIEESRRLFRQSALLISENTEDPYEEARMLDQLARRQAEVGDRSGLIGTFSGIGVSETGLDRAVLLVQAFAEAGDIASAEAIVRHYDSARGTIQWIQWRLPCQLAIADAYSQTGRPGEARQIRVQLARDLEESNRDGVTYGSLLPLLIGALHENGQVDEAVRLLEFANSSNYSQTSEWSPTGSLISIAESYRIIGYESSLQTTIDTILGNLERYSRSADASQARSTGSGFDALIRVLHSVGDQGRVLTSSDTVFRLANRLSDDDAQSGILWFHTKTLAALGYFNRALQAAEGIRQENIKAYAVFDVVEQMALTGQIEEAIETSGQISDSWKRAEALVFIGRESGGEVDRERVFSEALSAVRSIQDPHWRAIYWAYLSTIVP